MNPPLALVVLGCAVAIEQGVLEHFGLAAGAAIAAVAGLLLLLDPEEPWS